MNATGSGHANDPTAAVPPIDATTAGVAMGANWDSASDVDIPPLRKAAIVLVSLEQSLASQLLSHLDRSAVEMVTWEIARLDRVDPEDARRSSRSSTAWACVGSASCSRTWSR